MSVCQYHFRTHPDTMFSMRTSPRPNPPSPKGEGRVGVVGEFLPFVKGGKEGFILACLNNFIMD